VKGARLGPHLRFARVPAVLAPTIVIWGLAAVAHCGKATPGAAAASTAHDAGVDAPSAESGEPMDAREAEQWARAKAGDADELIRLEALVGCTGLRERASEPALRRTAIAAMAYCPDFSEVPWLVDLGTTSQDDEALDALDAVVEEAAAVRRATDPEDADELHAGCGALLALARTPSAPRPRRVRAVRALRMLADRGCVKLADVPHDVDAP
jgi:hypothetical protein